MTSAATTEATTAFFDKSKTHFREFDGLKLSSIGIGSYLGTADDATDASYSDAVDAYVEAGGNVIDTAANYRYQRSERAIGGALASLREKGVSRESLFIATKGGYLPFDGAMANDVRTYFQKKFIDPGHATIDDLVSGSHCMTPGFLQSQIDQSLANLGVSAVDLFYIHNPETQLGAVDKYMFEARLAKAFEKLEENRADGKIKYYGVATWNGFRIGPDQPNYHSLERMTSIAKLIGGENHGFKFVQLPHNLAMPEAYLMRNQAANGKVYTPIEAANEVGVAVMCSASILQGQLAHSVPIHIREALGNRATDAMSSIEFVRSTPGVTTALVGMSKRAHVDENMLLAGLEPVGRESFEELFTSAD